MVTQNHIAKLEARIDAISVLICTMAKHQGLGADQNFLVSLETNMQSALDLSLLTHYPDAYLEELRAFASHLQERMST